MPDKNTGDMGIPFSPSQFGHIKLGHGVTGMVAYSLAFIIVGLFSVAGLLAFADHTTLAVFLCGLAVLVFLVAGWKIFDFAEKHPAAALLQGSEFNRYIELQQASKEPVTIELSATPVANTPPPGSISFGGDV